MTKDEFIKAFFEGSALAPQGTVMQYLAEQMYELRQQVYSKHEQIEFMDEVARDNGWSMKCRSCGKSYEPDCELSEMFGSENYCGGSQWCTP
ncbi:hypothetical protein D3C75_854890 [compost metagenome]